VTRRPLRPALSLSLVIGLVACDSRHDSVTDSALVEEREAVGDTTIVRIRSGSAWGAPAIVVEELAIGSLEGAASARTGRSG